VIEVLQFAATQDASGLHGLLKNCSDETRLGLRLRSREKSRPDTLK